MIGALPLTSKEISTHPAEQGAFFGVPGAESGALAGSAGCLKTKEFLKGCFGDSLLY
jgi:hypothetical protein